MRLSLLLFLLYWSTAPLAGQIILNEVASTNARFEDEDGDTPDWIELHNPDATAHSLAGWHLSDDRENLTKWSFGQQLIEAGGYLLVWASDKDRYPNRSVRALVNEQTPTRIATNLATVDHSWRDVSFADSTWQLATTGIGFGDGDDSVRVTSNTRSIYSRQRFTVDSLALVERLLLHIDYDDGFVAYINGQRVASANVATDSTTGNVMAQQPERPLLAYGKTMRTYSITLPESHLRRDTNLLAIEVHAAVNLVEGMSLRAYLSAEYAAPLVNRLPPAAAAYLVPAAHTNFKISSEGESVFLSDAAGRLVDSLIVPALPREVTYGRSVLQEEAVVFATPTPARPNATEVFTGIVTNEPVFSSAGGLTEPFALVLSGTRPGQTIRYTVDGSEPRDSSTAYLGPLPIDTTTVVRARIFAPNQLPSAIGTRTYLVDVQHDLGIVSLVADPHDLFDPYEGMYVVGRGYRGLFPFRGSNLFDDLEIPAHFTLLEGTSRAPVFTQGVGIKLFGGFSRGQAQKSFALNARSRYGAGELDHPFFPNLPTTEYERLVLRNSGNDWLVTHLRDLTMTGSMQGTSVPYQANRPVVTYLNGTYWGLYNLRERIGEDYLKSRYGVEKEDLDLLENNAFARTGSNTDYVALRDYVADNDMSTAEAYEYVNQRIDLLNFAEYYAAQIYFGNHDWPKNNVRYWRDRAGDGKWRWILYDTDYGGNGNGNATTNQRGNSLDRVLRPLGDTLSVPPWSNSLFVGLMDNQTIRHQFVNTMADFMNSRWLPDSMQQLIYQNAEVIASEIPQAFARWDKDPADWEVALQRFDLFFQERPTLMKQFVRWAFDDVTGHNPVQILQEPAGAGYVKVNSLTITEPDWTGDYFRGVPITLEAVPRPGYQFVRWELDIERETPAIRIIAKRPRRYRAVFVDTTTSVGDTDTASVPSELEVGVFPNPARVECWLDLMLPRPERVACELVDALGRRVWVRAAETLEPGKHLVAVEVAALPRGSYFLRVELGQEVVVRRVGVW